MTLTPTPPRRLRDLGPAEDGVDLDAPLAGPGLDVADFGSGLHRLDYVQLCSVRQCRNAASELVQIVQVRGMEELRESILDFLQRGLQKTGWKPYRWAREAGVSPTTITRPLNDPNWKYLPKLDTLAKLAAVAGMELPGNLKSADLVDISPIERSIPVLGDVRAGSWERIPDEPDVTEWLPMEVPEYAGASLFALRVVGRSMDLIYPDGTYVICAPPAEVGLREGDCVVVRRRNSANLAETTLKQVERQRDGSYILQPRSSDPAHQEPIVIPKRDADELAQQGVEIIGIVLVAYSKDRRGRGPLISL